VGALIAGAATALIGLVVPSLRVRYDYSWFVGFAVSFVLYYALMKLPGGRVVSALA
jgi:NCS1 family nucleobase:cation symporter-1